MASKTLLECDKYYHIFNHAISNEMLYHDNDDYCNFMDRYINYVSPVADTLAFCFMPNHYHLCLKIKSVCELLRTFNCARANIGCLIYRSMANFLNGFVQRYNRKNNRIGGLFVGNFKRKEIISDSDLIRLICYIHKNPVKAGLTSVMEEWPYSSYRAIISGGAVSKIPIWMEEHYRIFNDLENLIFVHNQFEES